jgi:putative nucleotidyltransferase with HDIG domain
MRKFLHSSLRLKIALFIIILLLLTASIFSLLTIQTMNSQVLDEILKRAESLSKSTAALAPYSMLSGDMLGIDNIVSKVKEANSDVEYVAVADGYGRILAHTDITKRGSQVEHSRGNTLKQNNDGSRISEIRSAADDFFELTAPIVFNNKPLGSIILGVNKSVLEHARAQTRRRIVVGLAIVMVLGIGCIIVLSSLVTRPIKELSRGVCELRQGRRAKLKIYSHDELGGLTEGFNQMTELISKQQASLSASAHDLEEAYISTVKVLSAAIDARDPYTLGHSTRVSKLSLQIGKMLGFSRSELEDLEIASLFHDVGKLKTPDYVLLKEGPLNPLELHEISDHPEQGAAILSRAKSLHKYIPAVRHHHEWYNGEGYPDGLRGNDIPLHAAIIAVADAFDAMTSSRPYKKPLTCEEALGELNRYSGKQFAPRVVEVFHQVVESSPSIAEHYSTRS